MDKRKRLKQLIANDGMVVAPGAFDALTARIVQQVGFDVCYMGGNGTVASMLGVPDIGLASSSEMVERARNINNAIDIPLICDADTGYGNVNNVVRAVRDFEQAGVAGIHIEDQVTPKRCGAMEGLKLVSAEECAEKIRAAVDTRRDSDFLIIARTDARAVHGLSEAIRRVQMFEAAGADLVFAEMLESLDEIRSVVSSVGVPVLQDTLETSPDVVFSHEELEAAGVKVSIHSMLPTLTHANSMMTLMSRLRSEGTSKGLMEGMMDLHRYEEILGIKEQAELQKTYGT
ncbi:MULTISPECIES: isocitrate lyase/PEP mutase family protein [unclassified Roseovarius]|uniref:isocitrate lyase/PEP mutase family protein n=1 Tax=unclassified Roseovarius TaxID=2614913 RepID=UPI00273E836A|nr:oxaloacetate decarboxylase [Roseovarius sp. MMSF_3350]